MATVTLDHVSKSFRNGRREMHAVDDLCLSVSDGELLVLVGPSGCGKTTTLRLIAGLEKATSGTIRIGGRDVGGVAPKERDVAMVFQDYALYPHMSVHGNLAFGLKMHRVPRIEINRKVEDAAAMLGIGHLLDRKPGTLSGGECQRVAVGRAIVRSPSVFLFDEPLSNLDAGQRVHMRTEIKTLQRTLRTTMIYVTHDQEEAMALGDRIVVMKSGVGHQCGPPLELYNRPADRFVAGFMGTPSMNLVEGRLQREGDSVCFTGSVGRLRLPPVSPDELKPGDGRAVVLGIRPEHVRLRAVVPPDALEEPREQPEGFAVLSSMKVGIVEPLGDCVHAHLVTSTGEMMVARMPPSEGISPGQAVTAIVDVSRVHLFSADEPGERIHGCTADSALDT